MFLPIRNGISKASSELEVLKKLMVNRDDYLNEFEYALRNRVASKIKEGHPSKKKKDVVDEGSQTPHSRHRSPLRTLVSGRGSRR